MGGSRGECVKEGMKCVARGDLCGFASKAPTPIVKEFFAIFLLNTHTHTHTHSYTSKTDTKHDARGKISSSYHCFLAKAQVAVHTGVVLQEKVVACPGPILRRFVISPLTRWYGAVVRVNC